MRCCPHCHRVWVEESDYCPADGAATIPLPEPGDAKAPDPLRGVVLGGRYKLLEMLGSGGMGFVYIAEQKGLRRQVAVKMLYAERTRDPASLRRFAREAQALANLDHPALVRVLDHGEGTLPYIAMELVLGEPLDEVLDRQGTLTVAQTVALGRQLAEALHAAHERGITHRDLKPSNVHLSRRNGALQVRVLDFGLALMGTDVAGASTTRLTRVGLVAGTPEYMAPEQVRGQDLDGRADLYALGVLLYECLRGEPPFVGGPPSLVVSRHLEEEPAPLPELAGVPATVQLRLGGFLRRLMAKHRADRPRNGAEVAAVLRDFEAEVGPPEDLAAITRDSTSGSLLRHVASLDLPQEAQTPSDEWPEAASPGDVAFPTGTDAPRQPSTLDALEGSSAAEAEDVLRAERRRYRLALGAIAVAAVGVAAVLIPSARATLSRPPAGAETAPAAAPAVALALGDGQEDVETDPRAVSISAQPGGEAQRRYEARRRELERELAARGLRYGDLRDAAQLRAGLQAVDRAAREGAFETATVALNALATAAARVPVADVLSQRLAMVERLLEDDDEPVHKSQARALRGALAEAPSSRAATRSFLRSLDDLERALR